MKSGRTQRRQRVLMLLRDNALLISTIVSVFLGTTVGLLCRRFSPSSDTIVVVEFPGEIFMRMLKMLMVPLIVSSMITGVAGMDRQTSGKMGLFMFVYYVSTTVIAIILGFVLVFTIKPGDLDVTTANEHTSEDTRIVSSRDVFMDLVRNLFPENIVRAAFQTSGTGYTKTETSRGHIEPNETSPFVSGTNISTEVQQEMKMDRQNGWEAKLEYKDGVNTIGLLVYCCVFGAVLGKMGKPGNVLLKFFNAVSFITMKMVRYVMWYSPIGIFSLVTGKILGAKELVATVQHLGMYMVTSLTGLFIHTVFIIPLIYFAFTRKNPFRVSLGILQALVTAFGTDSSAATLPVTIRCCEEKLKIDPTITRFVLPIGATVNMDAAGIFQVVTSVYLAQLNRLHLGFSQVLTLGLASTLGSIGAAGVPGTGIMVTMMVMISVGLPVKDLYMILAVDWCMGRMRTMTNVSGDCMAASILQHIFKPGEGDAGPKKEHRIRSALEDARDSYIV